MMDEDLREAYGPQQVNRKTAWMITFADLLSLMLTFFVLLYSMSVINKAKWEEVVRSLQQRLNPERVVEITFTEDRTIVKREQPPAADLDYIYTILSEKLNKVVSNDIALLRLDDRVVISLASDLLFEAGKADINPAGNQTLTVVSDAVGALNNKITINGHTDPRPINTEDFPSNWELSLARANRIAERLYASGYLFSIEVYGLGASRHDEILSTGRQKNRLARRVDIEVRNVAP